LRGRAGRPRRLSRPVDWRGGEWIRLSKKLAGFVAVVAQDLLAGKAVVSVVCARRLWASSFMSQPRPTSTGSGTRRWAGSLQMFLRSSPRGVDLRMVNLGRGFPGALRRAVAEVKQAEAYCEVSGGALGAPWCAIFGNLIPTSNPPPPRREVIIEPPFDGGDAGVYPDPVWLAWSPRKAANDRQARVYLDIGNFCGVPSSETRTRASVAACARRAVTARLGPVVAAPGPTGCDSADIPLREDA